jgi:hypothetical protein
VKTVGLGSIVPNPQLIEVLSFSDLLEHGWYILLGEVVFHSFKGSSLLKSKLIPIVFVLRHLMECNGIRVT